jgi:nucleoside-diphosphate-sugar epimerase
LQWPDQKINGKIYNAGWDNLTINQIAQSVQRIVGPDVVIERTETNDKRSYHISSEKIRRELGFAPKHSIEDAVRDLAAAFDGGLIPDPSHMRYYNIKTMQHLKMR